MKKVIFDTDILIDYLKGVAQAIQFLDNLNAEFFISTITSTELYCGIRNEQDERNLDTFLMAFTQIPVDDIISKSAGLLKNKYYKSHGIGLADAVIAATAIHQNAELITCNTKHYPMFKNLKRP